MLALVAGASAQLQQVASKSPTVEDKLAQSYYAMYDLKFQEAFKAADHDPQVGDKAVAGMDREPSQLIDQAGDLIAKASSEVAASAAATAQRATTISLVVMLVVCALGIAGAIAFSRTVVNPLDNAVRVSQAVAGGDLTVARHVAGKDEIALLLNALHDMQISLSRVVSNVRNNAHSVAAASTEIALGNNDLPARTA